MKSECTIIIVDDNVQFRANLKNYIENDLGCKVIAEASNGYEFMGLTNQFSADIILMDIAMEIMDGIEATRKAIWKNSFLKIIAVTMHTEKVFLVQLIEAGFKGCVFKSEIFKQLPLAIQTVREGHLYMPDELLFDQLDY